MSSDLRRYRPVLRAPAMARRRAREFLAEADADRRCQQVAELLVSELMTNAVVHARTAAQLSLSVTDGIARIEVSDDDPGQPVLREPDLAPGGFGLRLVEGLAESWGIIPGENGKVVWFTVPLSAAA